MNQLITFMIAVTLFSTQSAAAQVNTFLYYFDANLNPADKSQAVINGIGTRQAKGVELKLYTAANNTLLVTEHFTDSSLQVYDGSYKTFYKNGGTESEGNYVNNLEQGLWKKFDENGHTIDSSIFADGNKTMEVHTGYYKNGTLDSFIVNDVKADSLHKKYYKDNGEIASDVAFQGNNGLVQYYEKGLLKRTDTVFARNETEAAFPGGEKAWTQYISKELVRHADALTRDGQSGTCRIKFIVDKNGNIGEVQALTMPGSKLASIAINAIRSGPKWIPANQYGRAVNAFREQPVTFTIKEH